MRRDRFYSRAMHALAADVHPRFTALRYDGLDIVGHYYLRYTQPRTFRDVPEEDRRRFSQVIDRYYAFIDSEVAAALDTLRAGDLLMVVSGFGMQPMNPVKQALGRLLGDPDFSGTHERAPDGFLIAYGTAVEPGRRQRGSIVDVAPTVLYFLGPAGRRATWTVSPAPICSPARSRPSARSSSSRPTAADVIPSSATL